jgi:N4-(beta-N-acetylglucosaminyl)-L-asparaginase
MKRLLANAEAWPGFATTADLLAGGGASIDAIIAGISKVETEAKVRSVGYGGWPNMIGEMEFDAGVMDGTTRDVGAVGAVPGTLPVARLAREVMLHLPHVMLTGQGARRFATERGFAEDDTLHPDSKRVWWERLQKELSPEQLAAFPAIPLAPLSKHITDPERVRDTTVFLASDVNDDIGVVTSTSGWAWKYPGRLGDSPIPGAGFYADSRYGAAACTHTGEMTMRCATSRTIVLAMKLGHTLADAIKLAVEELAELQTGFLSGVVIHAIDAHGHHQVTNFRCHEQIRYWYWDERMSAPELRDAAPA